MSSAKFDLLILGGGQLAQMMFEESKKLSLKCGVVCSNESEPAAKIFGKQNSFFGNLQDPDFIQSLNKSTHLFTFENEFLDTKILNLNIEQANTRFFPNLNLLEKIQDKLEQKKICNTLKLPATNWIKFNEDSENLNSWIAKLQDIFGDQFVIKWARGGYDGKGVFVWRKSAESDAETLKEEAIRFCEKGILSQSKIYAEAFINFKSELACVGARNSKGQITLFPVVKSVQKNSICKYVFGPSKLFDIPEPVENKIFNYLETSLTGLNYVGCLAIEFFLDHEYQVWVNEFAPRVHNTGHYSQNAASHSQFELHLKAVNHLDLPVSIQNQNYFGMINLIGENTKVSSAPKESESVSNLKIHWYLKDESRAGRKMGHINIWGENESQFYKNFELAKAIDLEWSSKN